MLVMGRLHGLLASAGCKPNIARVRGLIAAPGPSADPPAARDTADTDLAATDKDLLGDEPYRAPACSVLRAVAKH
jgi:hypothetical protein